MEGQPFEEGRNAQEEWRTRRLKGGEALMREGQTFEEGRNA